MNLSPRLQAALPPADHPDFSARKAELERLVEVAGTERGLHAFGWLEGEPAHRQRQVDVFVEACGWHPDAPTFGGALSLARELPLDSPELPERMAEMERMVRVSTPETGLLAYRRLPDEPGQRQQEVQEYETICGWNHNLGRFGTARDVMEFVHDCPRREDALQMLSRLDWGDDWLSCDGALKQLHALHEVRKRDASLFELACQAHEPNHLEPLAGWLTTDQLQNVTRELEAGRALELLQAAHSHHLPPDELPELSSLAARSQVPVEELIETAWAGQRPVGSVSEEPDRWLLAGTVLPKRREIISPRSPSPPTPSG